MKTIDHHRQQWKAVTPFLIMVNIIDFGLFIVKITYTEGILLNISLGGDGPP